MLPGPASERDAPLSPEEVLDELRGLREMCDSAIAVAAGPEAIEPPTELDELRETLDLALEVNAALERRLAERERALQRWSLHRRLLPAPRAVG